MNKNFFLMRILSSRSYQIGLAVITAIMLLIFAGMHPIRLGMYQGRSFIRMSFVLAANGDSSYSFLGNLISIGLPLFIVAAITSLQVRDQNSGMSLSVIARIGRQNYLKGLYRYSAIASAALFLIPSTINQLVVAVTRLLVHNSYADPLSADVLMPLARYPYWTWAIWQWQHLFLTDLLYSLGVALIFALIAMTLVSVALFVRKLYQLVLLAVAVYLPFWGGLLDINLLMQPIVPAYLPRIIAGYVSLIGVLSLFNWLIYHYYSHRNVL